MLVGECRMLNFTIYSKEIEEDCSTAEIQMTYKEVIRDPYCIFNALTGEHADTIKRIKQVKLYAGKVVGREKDGPKADVLGGIEIEYETKEGETFIDGVMNLKCKTQGVEPQTLNLSENEFITSIYGTGIEYIKSLNIETNFYRKVK